MSKTIEWIGAGRKRVRHAPIFNHGALLRIEECKTNRFQLGQMGAGQ